MKPVSIELENFGPYAGAPTKVHFDALDRLFAITGDTGAGKTTLFDAMCFALYGKPLGTREATHLRSQLADPSAPTQVTFVFEANGERYKIRRTPVYQRAKKRGEGETKEAAKIELYRRASVDGEARYVPVQGKPAELERRLTDEIVKLSHDEFSKILVLPQGEFQRFLEMSTKERRGILEKLFPIDAHKAITDRAKELAVEAIRSLQAIEQQLTERRRDVDVDAYPARRAALEGEILGLTHRARELEAELADAQKAFGRGRELEAAHRECEARLVDRESLALQQPQIDGLREELEAAARAERVRRHTDALAVERNRRGEAEKRIAMVRGRIDERKSALVRATQAYEEMPKRIAERDALASELRAIDARYVAIASARRLSSTLKDARTRIADAGRRIDELEEKKRRAQAAMTELDAGALELEATTAARGELAEREKRIARHATSVRFLLDYRSKTRPADEVAIANERAMLATREHAVNRAKHALAEAQAALGLHHAARLAVDLAPDEPCPVCGSREHPNPARHGASEGALLDAIASAEAQQKAALELAAATARIVAGLEAKREQAEQRAEADLARLADDGFGSVEAYEVEAKEVAEGVAKLEGMIRELKARIAVRADSKKAMDALVAELERAARARGEREAELARFEGEYATLPEDVRAVVDLEAEQRQASARKEALSKSLAEIDAELESTRTRLEKLRAEQLADDTLLEATRVDLARLDAAVVELEAAAAEALEVERFASAEAVQLALRDADAQRRSGERIRGHDEAVQRIEARLQHLRDVIGERARPDLAALEQRQAEANTRHLEAVHRVAEVRATMAQLEQHLRRYEELVAQREKLERDSGGLLELSKDLQGMNSLRLDFPTFVLGAWLERVLFRASDRLRRLSGGRYSFERNAELVDGRSAAGLEIDVSDAYAGARRSVRTLSGGEKFLASLALALGLSDVIEERSGGIELDTLFIDEGFGSLDPEALDRALTILDELGGQKRVGVISHVDAMKTAIPCQLVVEKTDRGSRVRVVGASPTPLNAD